MRVGAVLGDRFVLVREAGSGGMGRVFRAIDRRDARDVAVKVLRGGGDAAEAERFGREATILAGLGHPGIVRYVAHGVADLDVRYLAMEWLEGEDLAARLARQGLSVEEALTVVGRAADALAYAHARGVVHRDLKPQNLFLPGGDVALAKVVDFGIARFSAETSRLTRTGMFLGTPGYMGPEQLQSGATVDARTDVFSLGCVLFECLTGRPAFLGAHPMEVAAQILQHDVPRVRSLQPDAPQPLDDLVHRMLAKHPDDRPADCAELAMELARAGDVLSGKIQAPARTQPPPTPRSAPRTVGEGRATRKPAPGSLGLGEVRLVSVVLAGAPSGPGALAPATVASEGALPDLWRLLEPHGARMELAAGSSVIATVWGRSDAPSRADRAARCALALRAGAHGVPVCIVAGRAPASGRLLDGELIERGLRDLAATPWGRIHLDAATARALSNGPSFSVSPWEDGAQLEGARAGGGLDSVPPPEGTPCVGRERELALLEGALDATVSDGCAGAVLVTGPAGVGKSRLARALEERLTERDAAVEILRARGRIEGRPAEPFGVIADTLRRAAGLRPGEPGPVRRRKLVELLGRRLSGADAERAVAVLGALADTSMSSRGVTPAVSAVEAAWEAWLSAECAARPVLWVIDDLHAADAASVRVVDATVRRLGDRALCVVGLGRPETHARFPDLWNDCPLHVVRLGALLRRAGEALARAVLGESTRPEVVAHLFDRAAGNPHHLRELARTFEAGLGDAFPEPILEVVEARLDAQGAEAKRLLRAASVFGERFARDGVAALTAMEPSYVGERLDELAGRELVGPGSSISRVGDTDYVFRHAVVRDAAYATLTDADRALGHRLAAEWLERHGRAGVSTLASHKDLAGVR